MRYSYFIILILLCKLLCGQIPTPVIGFGTEKDVIKWYKKDSLDKGNISNGYVMQRKKIGDTLLITIDGPSKQVRKMTFKSDPNSCDFDQITMLSCDTCTKLQIKTILEDGQMAWHKVAENVYLSKWFWKTELTIIRNVESAYTVLTFKCPGLDKAEYKRMYETGEYKAYTYETGKEEDDWYNKGYSAAKHKQYETAISYYTKSIELNPNFRDAYDNRGIAKFELGKYNEAIEDYNKSIELFADDADAYFNRGNANYNLERYPEAVNDYRKALQLRPNDKDTKRYLKDAIEHVSK